MKRQFKAEIQEDGLDLLLDTLTNAFGAILLIGLLLAILVQESAADKQHEESENNESQTELLSEELTNLHLRLQQLAIEAKFLTEQLSLRNWRMLVPQMEMFSSGMTLLKLGQQLLPVLLGHQVVVELLRSLEEPVLLIAAPP